MAFEERNIGVHHQYLHELRELGATAVPTTVIAGRIITGFRPEVLRRLLDM